MSRRDSSQGDEQQDQGIAEIESRRRPKLWWRATVDIYPSPKAPTRPPMAKINISTPAFNKEINKAFNEFADEVNKRVEEVDSDLDNQGRKSRSSTKNTSAPSTKKKEIKHHHQFVKSSGSREQGGSLEITGTPVIERGSGTGRKSGGKMAQQHLMSNTGWLSFDPKTPRLYITAESEEFDQELIQAWKEEGFDVVYVAMGESAKEFRAKLEHFADGLSLGDRYGIVGKWPLLHSFNMLLKFRLLDTYT
jgi:hypothetical protein